MALTLETINELLSDTKQRGVYEAELMDIANSQELARDVFVSGTNPAYFAGKDANAVKNSFNLNITKKSNEHGWPVFSVVVRKEDGHVIVINMDAVAEARAAQDK